MPTPEVQGLDPRRLELVERYLVEAGAPMVRHLRSGLPAEEIEHRLVERGFSPHPDLIVWFGWHNGLEDGSFARWIGGSNVIPNGLDWAFTSAANAMAGVDTETVELLGEIWSPSWFPFATTSYGAEVALETDPGAPAGVYHVDWWALDTPLLRPAAPSLGVLVEWWIAAFAAGHYVYDAGRDQWSSDPGTLPEDQRRSQLV